MERSSVERAAVMLLSVVLGVVVIQAFLRPHLIPAPPQDIPPGQPCEGEPIIVDYPYYGGQADPHECKVQCDDGMQRYILYTDGQATPCQKVPGCLDWGEDHGVTCTPPAASMVQDQ